MSVRLCSATVKSSIEKRKNVWGGGARGLGSERGRDAQGKERKRVRGGGSGKGNGRAYHT